MCPVSENTKGIVLDVDGTLYLQPPLRLLMLGCFAAGFLLHPIRTYGDLRILAVYRRIQESLRSRALDADGSDDPQEIPTSRATGQSRERIRDAVERWMNRTALRLIPWVARRRLIRHVRKWHSAGIPIGVYSDYPSEKKLRALGLYFLVEKAVSSTDPGIRSFKPDPRGFLEAARNIGVPPRDAVFVGDRADTDGRGASRAGMQVLLLGRWTTSRASLRQLDRILSQGESEF